jgi:hypothetical protein
MTRKSSKSAEKDSKPLKIQRAKPRSESIKTSISSESMIVKSLLPRDPDTKYYGDEPSFHIQPDSDLRQSAIIRSLNWYNHFYGRSEAKDFLAQYVENYGYPEDAKAIRRINEQELRIPLCFLARMSLRGLELTETEIFALHNDIARLLKNDSSIKIVSQTGGKQIQREETAVKNRPSIQDIMKERTREAGGELEGIMDEFIQAGTKYEFSGKTIGILSEKNIQPQHINILLEVWKAKLAEFEEVYKGSDKQLTEGYSNYSRTEIKATIKFIQAVITDLNGYVSIKKAQKAPRARRAISPEKQVSKMKYLKRFDALKLESVHPSKIIGANEVWAYDTAKRKIHYYIADSHSQTLGVKGSTILGFDPILSGIKTIRKPEQQLKEFMASGIPAGRKMFKEIKSVQIAPKGRTNDDLIILRVK